MKKILGCAFIILLFASLANAGMVGRIDNFTKKSKTIARFGVITDIHHTNKTDTATRKYSAALAKTKFFVNTMNRIGADFVIELGDFVETTVGGKDPVKNFLEVENIFTSFKGPQYHVLGNHEFDDLSRSDLLENWDNTGINRNDTYYSFDLNGIHCVVLDADFTVEEKPTPFDSQDPADPFWNWKEAWIPREELDWLEADLAESNLPTAVFTHQVLHRHNTEDHCVKNAHVVRGILESDGQVLAVFSGHDHRGEIAVRKGIHYFILEGNVGMSIDWAEFSPTNGLDSIKDCPFTFVEIKELEEIQNENSGEVKTYEIILKGNAQQYTYMDQVQIAEQ